MLKENINDFFFFTTLAHEASFTKAAAKLGLSQSALSHAIKSLENRLEIRLFNRTTRSVSLTDAGERLLQMLEPLFNELEDELQLLRNDNNKPSGTIRISSSDFATKDVLWPVIKEFARKYPDIHIEINSDNRLTDIVSERFDAGVRSGDQVAKDMIAVRISPDIRFAVVCAPEYLQDKAIPQSPEELVNYSCINLRLNTQGGLYAWEFKKDNKTMNVRVKGAFTFNTSAQMLEAALDGFGFAFVPEPAAMPYIRDGRLISVLQEWCPKENGLYLYYPSRHQHKIAFRLLVDALRYSE